MRSLKAWKPTHKFKAVTAFEDGIKFGSKLERDYYRHLKLLTTAGEVVFILRQVPFHLDGGVTYRCDFVEFRSDGSVRFTDTKGIETKDFIMKKKMVEAKYPVEIQIVKRRDF